MTRARIEGLLAAFAKLVNPRGQHTYVETDAVRYVYHTLEVRAFCCSSCIIVRSTCDEQAMIVAILLFLFINYFFAAGEVCGAGDKQRLEHC